MSLDLSNLQLKDIKYILAVYRMKNFRKASAVCGVSQATISGQVFKIERLLNLKLIDRNSRTVQFTDAGERIVEQLNKINDEFKVLSEVAFQEQKKHTNVTFGEFNIGLIPTIAPFFVDCVFDKIKNKFKDFKFNIVELTTDRIVEEFSYNNIDLAIAANHPSIETPNLDKIKFGEDELVLLINHNNPNLTSQEIEPSTLKDTKVFLLNEGNCLREQALNVCYQHLKKGGEESVIDTRYGATSLETLKSIVANDIGVSIVPAISLEHNVPVNVEVCRIVNHPTRELFVLFDQNSNNFDFFQKFSLEIKKIFLSEYNKIGLEDKFYKDN